MIIIFLKYIHYCKTRQKMKPISQTCMGYSQLIKDLFILAASFSQVTYSVYTRYPLTLGGFQGDTTIQHFEFNSASNLFVTGLTHDTALVQTPGANFFGYMSSGMQYWNYLMELPYQNEDLISFSLRYDGTRAVLLYQSNLMVILNITSSNVVISRAFRETSSPPVFDCTTLGCSVYFSTAIILIGSTTSGSIATQYFMPDTLTLPSTTFIWQAGADAISYTQIEINYDYIFYGIKFNTYSGIIAFELNYVSAVFAFKMQENAILKGMDSLKQCVSSVTPCPEYDNNLFFAQYVLPDTLYFGVLDINVFNLVTYVKHTRAGATNVKILSSKVQTINTACFMVQFGGLNEIVIFCSSTSTLRATVYKYYGANMVLSNGQIYAAPSWNYFAGFTPWELFQGMGTAHYRMSYIHTFIGVYTRISNTLSLTQENLSFDSAVADLSISLITTTKTSIPFSLTLQTFTNGPINFKQPTVSIPPPTIFQSIASPTQEIIFALINDMAYQTITNPTYPIACFNTINNCDQVYIDPHSQTLPPGLTIIIDSNNNAIKIHFTDLSFLTSTQEIYVDTVGVMSPSMYCNSGFRMTVYIIKFLKPQIIPSTGNIVSITYFVQDPPKTTIPLPPIAYSDNVTVTYPQLENDPRLKIHYELRLQSNGSVPIWLTSYDQSTREAIIQTNDNAHFGTYPMKIVSWFEYDPTTIYDGQTFNFIISFDPCRTTIIQQPIQNQPFFYQIGEGETLFQIEGWTHTLFPMCGQFTFTLSLNPMGNALSIVNDGTNSFVRISTNNEAAHMEQNSSSTYKQSLLTASLYKTYPSDQYKSSSGILRFRIISTLVSYIIPPVLQNFDYTYIIGQNQLIISCDLFQVVDTDNLDVVTSLIQVNGNPIDTQLFTHEITDNVNKIIVKSNDVSKIGVYELQLQAKFNNRMPYSVHTQTITVTVLHYCTQNVITSAPMQNQTYYIQDEPLLISIPSWNVSLHQCSPLKLKTTLFGGYKLPKFITFNNISNTISVFSQMTTVVGTYELQMIGETQYFNPSSNNLQTFSVTVLCATHLVIPRKQRILSNAIIGITQKIIVDQFNVYPKCGSSNQNIIYIASLPNDEDLPQYIKFQSSQRQLTIEDDGSMIPGTALEIKIIGIASDLFAQGQMTIKLSILPRSAASGYQLPITLPEALIMMKPFDKIQYRSLYFANFTEKPYRLVIIDQTIKFVTLLDQTLVLTPTVKDIGTNYIQLEQRDSNGNQIRQNVKIQVAFAKEQTIYGEQISVEAKILRITKQGLVTIQFNQIMSPIFEIGYINSTVLSLSVFSEQSIIIGYQKNFTWETASFEEKTLKIQLLFHEPLKVSINDEDFLEIQFTERSLFQSRTGVLISSDYKIRSAIPKQLDNSTISKYVDRLTTKLQDGIDKFSSESAIFNIILQELLMHQLFISGFVMSRLWGMINSMQIIVLMPLISIDFPANVQLVYYFIQNNMNFQILPFKLNEYGIFDFDATKEEPFTRQFAEQDIFQQQSISKMPNIYSLSLTLYYDNIIENFMNLVAVLLGTCVVRALEILLTHWQFKIISLLKNIFIYNFLVIVLIENSLQFILFSLINIANPQNGMRSASEITSYIFSLTMIIALFSLGVLIVKVDQNRIPDAKIKESHPKIAALFELLNSNSKFSLAYNAVFLIRRLFLAVILVAFKASKMAQIFSMMVVSILNLSYLIKFKPFEKQGLNRLEIFNEFVILACYYHLLMFTSGLTDDVNVLYSIGWVMVLILLGQFGVNVGYIFYKLYQRLVALKNRLLLKWNLRKRVTVYQAQKKVDQLQENLNDNIEVKQPQEICIKENSIIFNRPLSRQMNFTSELQNSFFNQQPNDISLLQNRQSSCSFLRSQVQYDLKDSNSLEGMLKNSSISKFQSSGFNHLSENQQRFEEDYLPIVLNDEHSFFSGIGIQNIQSPPMQQNLQNFTNRPLSIAEYYKMLIRENQNIPKEEEEESSN